ncbi:MAG: hypothetical protein AAB417_03425 [Patescibacteria group bacterium]
MNIEEIVQSKIFTGILSGIAITIVALLIFQAGIMVGHRKAAYSYHFGETYYRTFGRSGDAVRDAFPGELAGGHGAVGRIIKLEPPTIVVEGPDNIEKIITIGDQTIIKRFRDTITVNDLKLEDHIIVIGEPYDTGTINARLIRVMPGDMPPPFLIKLKEQ